MTEIRYAIAYEIGSTTVFIGIDGATAAEGYLFTTQTPKAIRFTKEEDAAAFITATGPEWCLKMCRDNLLRIVRLKDGVPS